MDIFFVDFRDPIFGIVVFISTVLVIAIFSYVWGVFKSKDEKNEIANFLKKFENGGLSDNNKKMLENAVDNATLHFLANTFAKSGYFEKAISMYLIALNKAKSRVEKEQIFTDLGQVYLKAGFMQKAKNVFLEALKISPRNKIALNFLTITCEKLKDYKTALDALDALMELGTDVKSAIAYVKSLMILSDKDKNLDTKIKEILIFKNDFALISRLAMEYFKSNGGKLENFKHFPPICDVIDLIYYQNDAFNLSDPSYKSIFFIKGLSQNDGYVSLGFEFDMLKILNKSGYNKASMTFNYVCKHCRNVFPMHFYRCPICNDLGSVKIVPHITEKSDENSMPF